MDNPRTAPYNGGMPVQQCKCHWCRADLVRFVDPKKDRLHFCNRHICKAAYQKMARPVTKEWLEEHYINQGLDTTKIGHMVGRDPKSVWNWLKDFGIPTRPRGGSTLPHAFKKGDKNLFEGRKHTEESKRRMSDIAKAEGRVPYDPAVGSYMKGRKGADAPNWKGGITADRQAFYAQPDWKKVVNQVYARDKRTCQRCGKIKTKDDPFDIHHIVSFRCKELRSELSNLVLLCEPCHYWCHGNDNINKEFIKGIPDGSD